MGTVSAGFQAHPALSGVPEKELTPRAILVVDDEAAIRDLLAEMLRSAGHSVCTAGNAQEAMLQLHREPVAILITDVQLPGTDGITILQQALEYDSRILGIVMTGYGNVETAVRAMKAGAADFVSKPFQIDLVQLTVTRLLELYRLRQENTVLKNTLIRSGNIRVRTVPLADFGRGNAPVGEDGLTDFERGVMEGERRVTERVAGQRQREQGLVSAVVGKLEETWRGLADTVEEEVASLAFMISQKVVHEAVAEKRDVVVTQVKGALAHLHESGLVRVRVHPSDLPQLEAVRSALAQTPHGLMTVKLESDPSVTPGGCLVQTASLLIDATLETQLLRLGEALRKRETGEAA